MTYQQVPSGDEINQIAYQMCQHKIVSKNWLWVLWETFINIGCL